MIDEWSHFHRVKDGSGWKGKCKCCNSDCGGKPENLVRHLSVCSRVPAEVGDAARLKLPELLDHIAKRKREARVKEEVDRKQKQPKFEVNSTAVVSKAEQAALDLHPGLL